MIPMRGAGRDRQLADEAKADEMLASALEVADFLDGIGDDRYARALREYLAQARTGAELAEDERPDG